MTYDRAYGTKASRFGLLAWATLSVLCCAPVALASVPRVNPPDAGSTEAVPGAETIGLGKASPEVAPTEEQPQPAAATDEPQPTEDADAASEMSARVIEVTGVVEWSLPGVSPAGDDGWQPVKVDDLLAPGTQIRTHLGAGVNLQFGETTFAGIRGLSFASIDDARRSAQRETVKLGLGYGTIRGASSEGEVVSEVTVDSPHATLAKRGTEGWQIFVEAQTGRFEVSLAESGLVEAIQRLGADRTRTRLIRPGEYANQKNIANLWLRQAVFDRAVKFFEPQGITTAEAACATEYPGGLASLAPGAGTDLMVLTDRRVRTEAAGGITGAGDDRPIIQPPAIRLYRPEGNFGTGQTYRRR